ncbi:MAG: hypothetical protein DHS20C01_33040 [marine bacterium B5-7]|nr:MAG: hypothetical protein DHS20C01_33040 [marine bacterium B5-7]
MTSNHTQSIARTTVTVIIPTRNAARFLNQAIDSVLAQTYPVDEIIVVDGNSGDRSRDIALSYSQVTLVEQPVTGLGDAWNAGIDAAHSEWIAFLDSDDLWLPEKIENQIQALKQNPDAGLIDGKVRFFLESGQKLPKSFRPEQLNVESVGFMPTTWLVKRSVFDLIGTFDSSLEVAVDIDWYQRLRDAGTPIIAIDKLVAHKRVHQENLSLSTRSQAVYNHELIGLIKQSLNRRQRS